MPRAIAAKRAETRMQMTLVPIRGAPPGAPNPEFPIGEPRATSTQPAPANTSDNQPQSTRQRGAPIEICGDGHTLTFKVIPEIPAIRRASMSIHVGTVRTSYSHRVGFIQMSAERARAFLIDLPGGRAPTIAIGDEDGTVEIRHEKIGTKSAFSVHKPGERCASHRWVLDQPFDIKLLAEELLADLGL
jgi:hypothetical protein